MKHRKRGRPPADIKTVQVAVRLPEKMVEYFKRNGGVSKEIKARLMQSMSVSWLEKSG